jgi:hypothetical protein
MNKTKANKIKSKILQFLKKIEEEQDVKFSINRSSFSSTTLNLTIDAREICESSSIDDLKLSKKYGFSQNVIGMEFSCHRGTFIIESFKTRNRKYPIIAVRKEDGAVYKFHPINVLKYLGGEKIINRNANLKDLLG